MTLFLRRSSALAAALAFARLVATVPAIAADSEGDDDASASPAESDDASTKTTKKSDEKAELPAQNEADKSDDFGHGGQFGLRAGIVLGYRMVLRYDSSPYCAPPKPEKQPADQQKFCGYGAPPAVDLGLSFGLLDFVEPAHPRRRGRAPLHLAAGPQIDVHKNFGLYVTGGLSMGVVRALASSLDLNIGLQGRLP